MELAAWKKCSTPDQMVSALGDRKATLRRRRLLAVAFCRHIAHLMTEVRCEKLIEYAENLGVFTFTPRVDPPFLLRGLDVLEKFADGQVGSETLELITETTDGVDQVSEFYFDCYSDSWGPIDYDMLATADSANAVHYASRGNWRGFVGDTLNWVSYALLAYQKLNLDGVERPTELLTVSERVALCNLIRDVFPSSNSSDPSFAREQTWLSTSVRGLAEEIYKDTTFEHMPILADALEDAGCTHNEYLSHCRESGPHVRGCWVLDHLMDRT